MRWFNGDKGYGFTAGHHDGTAFEGLVEPIAVVQAAGLIGLDDGQKVTYDVVSERGKLAATNLRIG